MFLIMFACRTQWCTEFKLIQCESEKEARDEFDLKEGYWKVEYTDRIYKPRLPRPIIVWETYIEDLTYEG